MLIGKVKPHVFWDSKSPLSVKFIAKQAVGTPCQPKESERNTSKRSDQSWSVLCVFLALSLCWQGVPTAFFATNFALRGFFEFQNT